MCKSCNKSSCSGGCKKSSSGKDIATLQNLINEVSNKLDQVSKDTAFLKKGHPMMMLQNADDIASFSFDTGLGSGDTWEGWAICNGATHQNSITGKDFQVPNMLNRFPVAAGDTYDVNDTGGLDGVALSIPELPVHDHDITDPGHTHDIVDPAHNHGAVSPTHTHNITTTPHNHTTEAAGLHSHGYQAVQAWSYSFGAAGSSTGQLDLGSNDTLNTYDSGSHTHAVANATVAAQAESTAAAVNIDYAYTGIHETVVHNTDITINNTGGGEEHENRPPYLALLFVMKL